MQPRTELALGLGGLLVLAVIAGAIANSGARTIEEDTRRSSYLTGPNGARGLADALTRLGINVRRFRQRTRALSDLDTPQGQRVLAVLDPAVRIATTDIRRYLNYNTATNGGDLLLSGTPSEPLMRCFGFGVDDQDMDSVQVRAPRGPREEHAPWVRAVLAGRNQSVVTDSSRIVDVSITTCAVPAITRAETLLVSTSGRVVAVTLQLADPDRRVTLVSDGILFSNRSLRSTAAGPSMLGLFAGRYSEVVFDEYRQGFGAEGSLASAALAWSRESRWGWVVWQLVLVGTIALGFGAVRFGPARPVIIRKRRSPLEHVRALATALAAAEGYDVAVGSIVAGLRRRLGGEGPGVSGAVQEWLQRLAENVRSKRAQDAVEALKQVTRPGQTAHSVLRAANAVEDVWQELHP
jgi:hypothetical protein